MDQTKKEQLQQMANKIRLGVLECVYSANSGHPGGSLSVSDIITYLYFYKMNVDSNNPNMSTRDRFVLSKGHTSPALYSALAYKGFFSTDLLKTFRKEGSILQGHPDKEGYRNPSQYWGRTYSRSPYSRTIRAMNSHNLPQ